MFLGLRTAIYHVDDIEKAKAWYSEVLGVKPYFDQPFYVGFNVAGYELGLHPGGGNTPDRADGAVAYWGVANAEAAFKRIIELGQPFMKRCRTLAAESKSAQSRIRLAMSLG